MRGRGVFVTPLGTYGGGVPVTTPRNHYPPAVHRAAAAATGAPPLAHLAPTTRGRRRTPLSSSNGRRSASLAAETPTASSTPAATAAAQPLQHSSAAHSPAYVDHFPPPNDGDDADDADHGSTRATRHDRRERVTPPAAAPRSASARVSRESDPIADALRQQQQQPPRAQPRTEPRLQDDVGSIVASASMAEMAPGAADALACTPLLLRKRLLLPSDVRSVLSGDDASATPPPVDAPAHAEQQVRERAGSDAATGADAVDAPAAEPARVEPDFDLATLMYAGIREGSAALTTPRPPQSARSGLTSAARELEEGAKTARNRITFFQHRQEAVLRRIRILEQRAASVVSVRTETEQRARVLEEVRENLAREVRHGKQRTQRMRVELGARLARVRTESQVHKQRMAHAQRHAEHALEDRIRLDRTRTALERESAAAALRQELRASAAAAQHAAQAEAEQRAAERVREREQRMLEEQNRCVRLLVETRKMQELERAEERRFEELLAAQRAAERRLEELQSAGASGSTTARTSASVTPRRGGVRWPSL